MSQSAPRPCRHPGCRALSSTGYCDTHRKALQQRIDGRRGSARSRGYTTKWQKARADYLRRNPLCVCDDCKQLVTPLPASVVDHKIPHRGDMKLFWDMNNWQAMSKRCHDKKTATEDGGFGRDMG